MADKFVQLAVQIALCISLLWLVKALSGKTGVAWIVAAYILSLILTKGFFYYIMRRKMKAQNVNPQG